METVDAINVLCKEFAKLCGHTAGKQLAEIIVSQRSDAEIQDWIFSKLDLTNANYRQLAEELLRLRQALLHSSAFQVYSKPGEEEEYFSGKSKNSKGKKNRKSDNANNTPVSLPTTEVDLTKQADQSPAGNKRRSNFVPLFSSEGHARAVARIPGRHLCDCVATKHDLVNNCLSCGRIVCEQEGSGPCLFCGTLVCTKAEQVILDRGSKKSDNLRRELMQRGGYKDADEKVASGLQKAVEFKDRLLEYDRTSAKRTQVIDDQSDYFTVDTASWLAPADREALGKREAELREQRHGSRLNRKVVLDLAGRRVLEASDLADMFNADDEVVKRVYGSGAKDGAGRHGDTGNQLIDSGATDRMVDEGLDLPLDYLPEYVETESRYANAAKYGMQGSPSTAAGNERKPKIVRLQDRAVQEMSDGGLCLSMHQPWASLLVRGIKKHEGRSWYHHHRGRLWIAATARVPERFDIEEVEAECKQRLGDDVEFPREYPSGCLLGCLSVVDCLPQEEYREKYPDGESNSPFVFVCDDPCELVIKFPLKGDHKIYALESRLHQQVKKAILHSYAEA